jgi:hypothetical protein
MTFSYRASSLLLALLAPAAPAALAACSSTSQGNVDCPNGECTPTPVFATGMLSEVLVTPDAIYAAELGGCSIYAADKPLKSSRVLAQNACSVSSLARTSQGLFWTTAPTSADGQIALPGTLAWFGDASSTGAATLATGIAGVGSIAVLDDTVYVSDATGIQVLAADGKSLTRAVTSGDRPNALRAYAGTLYWHNGLQVIYSWRPGDAKPTTLVSDADLVENDDHVFFHDEPFAVDASGIYWLSQSITGGSLGHAALAGGSAQTLVKSTGYPKALALDDDAIYWTEADSFIAPTKTVIQRALKTPLGAAPLAGGTPTTVGSLIGDAHSLQMTPEGLYIAAAPSLSDLDVKTLGFTRYGGPLLMLPRSLLANHP